MKQVFHRPKVVVMWDLTILSFFYQKHIGQMFKNEVKIKDLPPIELPRKAVPSSLDEQDNIGLVELFTPAKVS